MKNRDPALHKGHRERMKKQFIKNGFRQFNEHQMLELLLFYSIPRGDTNELSHRLLNECGGRLCDVLNAPYKKLTSVKGIGEHSAVFLKLLLETASHYISSMQAEEAGTFPEGTDSVCRYFEGIFISAHGEEIHIAAADSRLRLSHEKKLADGDVGKADLSPRKIMEYAIDCGCDRVILAHNHPGGSWTASKEDIHATRHLVSLLREFGVEIADHIIVGKSGSMSLRSSYYSDIIWNG